MRFLTFFFLFSCALSVNAQNRSNIWYFGPNGAGLDFNSCEVQVLTDGWAGTGSLFEGSVTACDSNGNLLFYTGGKDIINRNHQIMPSGANIGLVSNTLTQNVIIKRPGSEDVYYLISTEVQASGMLADGSASIVYSVIDMSLEGGLGDVVSHGNVLKDTASGRSCEKLTLTYHSNGTDIWLLAHEYGNNNFLSWLVTSNGINTIPVVSFVDPIIEMGQDGFNAIGEIKFSPNGEMLAFTTFRDGTTAFFDFDKNSGVVSNGRQLDILGNQVSASGYGVSFSSDNQKLYVSVAIQTSTGFEFQLLQFDVSLSSLGQIQSSKTVLFSSENGANRIYSLKLAPDKKIYCGRSETSGFLGVVNFPDSSGTTSDYVHSGLYLNGLNANWGLNNSMELIEYCSVPPCATAPLAKFNYSSNSTTLSFADQSGGFTPNNWHWDFGDGATSTSQNPIHTYDTSGAYIVTFVACNGSCCDTVMDTITVMMVGINDIDDAKGISVYPVPADEELNIISDKKEQISYQLMDTHGRLLVNGMFSSSLKLNTSNIPSGIYFMELQSLEGGNIIRRKVLIE